MGLENLHQRHVNYAKIIERGLKSTYSFERDLQIHHTDVLRYLDNDGQYMEPIIDRLLIAMIKGATAGAYRELRGDGLKSLADEVIVETYARIINRMKEKHGAV